MSVFSKERLSKLVASARLHWWLFVPALLIISIGYLIFSLADSLHILSLCIRNVFLVIYSCIRNGIWGIALFVRKASRRAASSVSAKKLVFADKLHEMNENALTARSQLLNSAVEYCTERHARNAAKKAHLRETARAILDSKPTGAKDAEALSAASIISTSPEHT